MWWRACILMLALLVPTQISAFTVIEDTIFVGNSSPVYHIDGIITKETWVRFQINSPTIKTVVLNSGGGYVVYAEAIAKIIRERRITTKVRNRGGCLSACVLIFQSGVRRIAHKNAVFMLHPVTIKIDGAGVDVPDLWSTNRYFGWLMRYGMKVSGAMALRKNEDVYFNAADALIYGIATEIEGKSPKK